MEWLEYLLIIPVLIILALAWEYRIFIFSIITLIITGKFPLFAFPTIFTLMFFGGLYQCHKKNKLNKEQFLNHVLLGSLKGSAIIVVICFAIVNIVPMFFDGGSGYSSCSRYYRC